MEDMTQRPRKQPGRKQYVFASDFDKTLSFNDSGYVLAELLGVKNFEEKVEQVSHSNLVQQGGELAYLLLHDKEFKGARREHLVETGKRIHLKYHIDRLVKVLDEGVEDTRFTFFVISAAPIEVVQSALKDIVPHDHIFGTRLEWDEATGAATGIKQVCAGYGKVAVLHELQSRMQVPDERVIYSGDGSSDIHVMLHINQRKGYTIAVSQSQHVTQIAKRTVLSEDALGVMVPILEDICEWDNRRIRNFFEAQDLLIQEWAKMRTDVLTIGQGQG